MSIQLQDLEYLKYIEPHLASEIFEFTLKNHKGDENLSQMFKEFFQLAPKCKFNCCTHINEPRCAVKESVEEGKILKSRYENYLLFVEEIKKCKKKY